MEDKRQVEDIDWILDEVYDAMRPLLNKAWQAGYKAGREDNASKQHAIILADIQRRQADDNAPSLDDIRKAEQSIKAMVVLSKQRKR